MAYGGAVDQSSWGGRKGSRVGADLPIWLASTPPQRRQRLVHWSKPDWCTSVYPLNARINGIIEIETWGLQMLTVLRYLLLIVTTILDHFCPEFCLPHSERAAHGSDMAAVSTCRPSDGCQRERIARGCKAPLTVVGPVVLLCQSSVLPDAQSEDFWRRYGAGRASNFCPTREA